CDNTHYRPFLKFLPSIDSVLECHHITGGDAFLIKVTLPSIDQLEPLIERLLPYGMPTTSMVLCTPVFRQQEAWLLKHAGFLGKAKRSASSWALVPSPFYPFISVSTTQSL